MELELEDADPRSGHGAVNMRTRHMTPAEFTFFRDVQEDRP